MGEGRDCFVAKGAPRNDKLLGNASTGILRDGVHGVGFDGACEGWFRFVLGEVIRRVLDSFENADVAGAAAKVA